MCQLSHYASNGGREEVDKHIFSVVELVNIVCYCVKIVNEIFKEL